MYKRYFIVILLATMLFVFSGQIVAQYCIPTTHWGTDTGTFIDGVQISNLDNVGSGTTHGPFYNDFTYLPAAIIDTAGTNELHIYSGAYNGSMNHHAWIDFNLDYDFDDANEYLGTTTTTTPYESASIDFTVPAGALKGKTRLRVSTADGQSSLGSCEEIGRGEVEDYSVTTPGLNNIGIEFISDQYVDADFGDYDNDGDLDVLAFYSGVVQMLRNDGNDVFTDDYIEIPQFTGSAHAMADYDNDGDLDIAISGDFDHAPTARIYRNDGAVFTDIEAGITGLVECSLDWGDYNNDGRPDLVITGLSAEDEQIAILYRNEGLDIFTNSGIEITPGVKGDIKWGDIDNDEFPDLLIMGSDYNGNTITDVYRNDKEGHFVALNTGITNSFRGEVDFGDYNSDGYLDLVMCGQLEVGIYKNNGDLTFTDINASLASLWLGSVAWGDYDNDGDLDLLQTGREGPYQTHLYRNDGNDLFTEVAHELPGHASGSVAWGDYDNDSDIDLVMTGSFSDGTYTRIYRNDILTENTPPDPPPSNLYSVVINDGALLAWNGCYDLETFPNNQTLSYSIRIGTTSGGRDVLAPLSHPSGSRLLPEGGNSGMYDLGNIQGLSPGTYYWSVQAVDQNYLTSSFSLEDTFEILHAVEPIALPAPDVSNGGIAWGDYNSDGFHDILICGNSFLWGKITKILKNNGDYTFDTINAMLPGIQFGDVAWGDYDNDNDLDVLLSGLNGLLSSDTITKIFRNDGSDIFTDINAIIPGNSFCDVDWGDVDNDGDLDAIIAGGIESEIYRNEGNDLFTDMNVGLPSANQGTICLGDYDNDYDLDIVIGGIGQTRLYINDGKENFTLSSTTFPRISEGSIEFGDYDADSDLDLLFTGALDDFNSVSIYSNEGSGVFTDIDAGIRGVSEARGIWGDFNNDYYPDILYTGRSGSFISKLYLNDKYGSFYDKRTGMLANYSGRVSTADIDDDKDLDILLTRYNDSTVLYRNNMNFPEFNLPGPENLSSENVGKGVILSWDEPEDMPPNGSFTYNVRIGSTTMATDIVSPMTLSPSSKKRLIPEMGNAQNNMGWKIDSLPVGEYFWSVQIITPSYNGGDWAVESSFTITAMSPYFSSDTECLGSETSFTDETIVTGTQIASWLWNFGDGNTSTQQHPKHIYSTPGSFTATLTVTDTSGTSLFKTNPVIVLSKPVASFGISDVCIGSLAATVNISSTDTLAILSWGWDYGDGSSASIENPLPHPYLVTGGYDIKLRIDAQNGCSDSVTNHIEVAEYPISNIAVGGNPTFCEGDSVKLSVPENVSYDYQWKTGGGIILGADSSVYIAKESGDYTVSVTNQVAGCNSESLTEINVVTVPIPGQPVILVSGLTNFCQGNSAELSVGYSTDYSYQWKLNGFGVGADTNVYVANDPGTYTLDVTNSSGCPNTSINSIVIMVNDNPSIPTVNVNGATTFCEGGSVNLSVDAEAGMNYQWYNEAVTVGGEISNTIDISSTGVYQLVLTNGAGCHEGTVPVAVTVNPNPTAPTFSESGPATFCDGGSVTLSVTNDPLLSYQWLFNGGATGSDVNAHTITTSGNYSLKVTNSFSCEATATNPVTVAVNDNPTVPTVNVSGATTFCEGGSVNLSVDAEAGMRYQWYNGVVTVGGAMANSLDVDETGNYEVAITNDLTTCVSETLPTFVTVNPNPAAPTLSESGPATFCNGGSVTLSVTNDPLLSYQWLFNGGATGSDVNEISLTAPGNYSLKVSNSFYCEAVAINPVTVLVNSNPTVPTVIVSDATTFCSGGSVNLSVDVEAGVSYQWYNGVVTMGGATTNSLDADVTGDYKLVIINDLTTCVSETLPTFVTVNPTPASPTISKSGPITFCDVDSVILSVTNDPTLNYQWLLNGGAVGTDINSHIVKVGGDYTIEVSNASLCSAISNTVAVTVFASPVIPTVGVNGETAFCEGQSVELSVTNDPAMFYQWKDRELNVGGATTNSYTASATGEYKLNISNGDGCMVETQVVSVIADPAPTAPTIGYTGAIEFCDTESLVLSVTDNPNYTYEWQLNGGTVGTSSSSYTANATGDYTVKVQNLGDCSVMSVNTVSLTVHASPASPTLNLSGATTFCNDTSVTLSVADPGTDSYQWISELGEMTDETGTSIIIEETGLYKVRVRNAGMCEAFSQEISVTVDDYPMEPVIITDNYEADGCPDNDPVNLSIQSAENGVSYQWSKDGNEIDGATSSTYSGYLVEGSYKVEADNNGCKFISQSQTISYGEMPDKPTILAEGPAIWYLACSNDSATAYKWYLDGLLIEGADEYLYVAGTQEGKFEVAISENTSCFAKSDPLWIPLGTNIDLDPWENLKIYPNPTPGLFTLEMDNHLMGELIIDIFGETGSKIINIKFQKETAHFKTQIDLSGQPPAAYLIGLMLEEYRTNRSLIVE